MSNPRHNAAFLTGQRGHLFSLARCALMPLITVGLLLSPCQAFAQLSQAEHESHHPETPSNTTSQQAEPTDADSPNAASPGGMMGGAGMGPGVMDEMMEKMGAPKPKDLYPTLMTLPDLPLEQRDDLKRSAHERMLQGTAVMSDGFASLSNAVNRDDYADMQAAVEQIKEGIGQYDSGLATHRALEEGKAPKNIALQWFKSQMNLLPASMQKQSTTFFGMTPFHSSLMLVLVLFALAMIWMYFFKLRRASALLAELATDRSSASGTPEPEPAKTTPVAANDTIPAPPANEATSVSSAPGTPVTGDKWSGELQVINQFQETPSVRTFRLADPDGAPLPFTYQPGQFLTFSLRPKDKLVKRSYTIASSPSQRDYIEVTVKREDHGLISRHLHDQVKTGDRLTLQAPAGKFFFNGSEAENIVLISGGVGVTPMMSVTRYLTAHGWPGNIYFLFCARTSNDFIFRQELEYLQQRHANLHVLASMTRAEGTSWMGPRGQFTAEVIKDFVTDIAGHRAHICGPPAMMDAIRDMLLALGVPANQIKTEAFGTVKRAPTAKPAAPVPTDQAVPKATFSLSQKTTDLPPGKTVLEAAEDCGVDIDNSCRSGTCGSCRVNLLSGQVSMEVEDALEPEDKAKGYILACQAVATEDVTVEA